MSPLNKMRGKIKGRGRCPIHGQWCCVANEIRANIMTRAREKRTWKKDAS